MKNVTIQDISPPVAWIKTRKFAKLSVKMNEVPFQRQLAVQPVIWNLAENSKGELEYASDLCAIYALISRSSSKHVFLWRELLMIS